MNEDKIKVLEFAIQELMNHDISFGICDALNFAVDMTYLPSIFRNPKHYGIILPPKEYASKQYASKLGWTPLFSYPCTKEGKQQRIKVLQGAIKKLQS